MPPSQEDGRGVELVTLPTAIYSRAGFHLHGKSVRGRQECRRRYVQEVQSDGY